MLTKISLRSSLLPTGTPPPERTSTTGPGQEFTDIFLAKKDKKGDWSNPILLDQGGLIDTKANEGTGQFNRKFLSLYFTRCWNEEKKKNGCAIYKVSRTGVNNWGEPERVDLGGDTSNVFGHPTLSDDETVLIFSTDLMGGRGGKDLWMVKRKTRGGAFGRPENLGSVINTPGDEMFPFLRDDSTLYFASNGHPGMGGLDIFRSFRENGKWSKPENMKVPINSSSDDFAMVFNLDEPEQGYLSSNRPGGKGKDDIYSFVIPPVYFTLEGTITDDRTLQPVAGRGSAHHWHQRQNGKIYNRRTRPLFFQQEPDLWQHHVRHHRHQEGLLQRKGTRNDGRS